MQNTSQRVEGTVPSYVSLALQKLAALTDREQAAFAAAIKNHTEYDRVAGSGRMTPEQQEAMRHNVARIAAFKAKKTDNAAHVPAWAMDLKGKKPDSVPPPRWGGGAGWHDPSGPWAHYQTQDYGAGPHGFDPDAFWKKMWEDIDGAVPNRRPSMTPLKRNLAIAGLAAGTLGAVGYGLHSVRQSDKEYKERKQKERVARGGFASYAAMPKAASSAPTRGGFMQASDLPPFRMPSLQSPLAKEGDMGFVNYKPGDFKPVDIMKKSAEVVAATGVFLHREKLAADITPSSGQRLGASGIGAAAARAKSVGLPRATTPAGPSIAQQAKVPTVGPPLPGATKGAI